MSEIPKLNNDFYNHINYDWLKNNPIPNQYTKWSNFNVLHEINQERLKKIVENEENLSDEQKNLNILWKKGLNNEELNNSKKNYFNELIDNNSDINDIIISLMKNNLGFLFDMEAYTDFKDSNRNILYFDTISLSLPDRDYYLLDSMKDKQNDFKLFLDKFLAHFNINTTSNDIYNFEEEIAKLKMSKTERRDPTKIYNLYSFEQIKNTYFNINWDKMFTEFNIPKNDKIIITEPVYFEYLNNYLNNKDNIEKLREYLKYKIAKTSAPFLDDATYEIYFDFFSRKLLGQKEPKPRWKRVLSLIDGLLGEVLSKVYIEKYFNEEQKKSCKNMIDEIKKTFEERLKNLDWMSDITKEKALQKLHKFNVKIGYPDKWTDFSKLILDENLSYFENILLCYKWTLENNLNKLYKPVDKLKWSMNAHDINAYYSPTMNEIVFPAGILQEPFYSSNQSLAENLGGIGAVIGHEITHGFDDKGRLYDLNGNLNNWWTEDDCNNFIERSKKLEELFNNYEYFGMKVNGKLTLGENIADLGGLTFSLITLKRLTLDKNVKLEIKQLFEQWAKIWRCNITDDTLKNQLLTDPHSPTQLRVNAILRNLDDFYNIYNITENDPMYLNPELRSKIW